MQPICSLPALVSECNKLGKPAWHPMLEYVALLHEISTRPAQAPFPYPWEEIGPGYAGAPAFGHWDIVHAVMDVIDTEPTHARIQLLNNLVAQEPDGLVPGVIWMRYAEPDWSKTFSHPPLWPVAVQKHADVTGSDEMIRRCYEALCRQIRWFENKRSSLPAGFYYLDILTRDWESGVNEGVRFDNSATGPLACVDATSHVYQLYDLAASWSEVLGESTSEFSEKRDALCLYIQDRLFDDETGLFHDSWAVNQPNYRVLAFEGMWPLVVGAATTFQAQRVIDENLLNPHRFFSPHPIATVGVSDPKFSLRMWRGPAWNSMTFWAATGCMRYGRLDAAAQLLENALDSSARQFEVSGTIHEFYHPMGGNPAVVERKPDSEYNAPCRDYLGHNPLIAMARLWQKATR